MKRAGRQIAILLFMVILVASAPETVRATSTQEKLDKAKEEKAQTESALQQTKENIQGMQGAKDSLQGQLSILNDNLEEVSQNLSELEESIADKEQEISDTQKALEEAQETVEWQYDCMKKRIKFIYERSDAAYMEILFSSGSFGDFLNKSQYIEQVAEYDRRMLSEYKETQEQIEKTKAELEDQKEELDGLREETEAEQGKVAGMVKSTANNIAGYADQISQAENVALAYEAQVKEQEANIAALQKQLAEEQAMSRLAAKSTWRDISEVTFAEGDRELLAQLIYCEAGAEPYAGKLAVGAVVINRVLSSVYPDTVVGVVYQNKQFSPVASGRLALALAEGRATQACYQAADEAMSGVTNVGNCVYFRTPIPGLTGISIGGHIFY
ncbi:MAG: cell wall hydrolase [Lachnospiraceae bacterium]|nr:cell wall hydrolase [Lachnospiraceae bacterium]